MVLNKTDNNEIFIIYINLQHFAVHSDKRLAKKSIYLSPYIAPVYEWRTEMDCELNIYKICDNLTPKFILFYFLSFFLFVPGMGQIQ